MRPCTGRSGARRLSSQECADCTASLACHPFSGCAEQQGDIFRSQPKILGASELPIWPRNLSEHGLHQGRPRLLHVQRPGRSLHSGQERAASNGSPQTDARPFNAIISAAAASAAPGPASALCRRDQQLPHSYSKPAAIHCRHFQNLPPHPGAPGPTSVDPGVPRAEVGPSMAHERTASGARLHDRRALAVLRRLVAAAPR